MACTMNAASMIVVQQGSPVAPSSSRKLASISSVKYFNNGGLHMTVATRRSHAGSIARPLRVRAEDESVVEKIQKGVEDAGKKLQETVAGASPKTNKPAETDSWGVGHDVSSTGGLTDKAKEAAAKSADTTTSVMDKLQDAGRDLRSKTGDVVYGAKRNAGNVDPDATE